VLNMHMLGRTCLGPCPSAHPIRTSAAERAAASSAVVSRLSSDSTCCREAASWRWCWVAAASSSEMRERSCDTTSCSQRVSKSESQQVGESASRRVSKSERASEMRVQGQASRGVGAGG